MAMFEKVRISFPRIVAPEVNKSFPDSPAKYSANFIIPKNHPALAEFMKEVKTLAVDKWKQHADTILGMANGNKKLRCYGAGEEILNSTTFVVYEGYADNAYISASMTADRPPKIMTRDAHGTSREVNAMEREEFARKLYGGCYVNVLLSPWLQDNAGGKAVRCNLVALEFAADGEPLGDGGGVDVVAAFGTVKAPAAAVPAPSGLPSFMS